MSTPTKDSKGHLVWKPQVGLYAKAAENQRESYGGIIGALQDLAVDSGSDTKAYPHNFAGIIAAIQDLSVSKSPPPVVPGPNPGGGAQDPITGEWQPIQTPRLGDLWFDERQGRLFVYTAEGWIQTNGADGLSIVTDSATPPTTESTPALGQTWYNRTDNQFYIHDGNYVDGDGNLVDINTPGATPLWRLINTDPNTLIQTTRTLPLDGTGPRESISTYVGDIITTPDLLNFNTQQDYNWWAFQAIVELEEEIINKSDVIIGDTPPTDPDVVKPGLLWYDTESLDLSIYYDDGDSQQWVPVSSPFTYDKDLDTIRRDLSAETRLREREIQAVYTALDNVNIDSNSTVQTLRQTIQGLESDIADVAAGNYETSDEIEGDLQALDDRIDSIVIPPPPDLTPYALQTTVDTLDNKVNTLPTHQDLNAVSACIPDVSKYLTAVDIDVVLNDIEKNYIKKSGGTLDNTVIAKTAYDLPAIDFSSSLSNSNQAFKFKSYSPQGTNNFTTYGTTNNHWEQAWKFSNNEDFCWVYNDSNKVFSISLNGPACSQLYIGDFQNNDHNGRVLTNTIDVRQRLTAYQVAFEELRRVAQSSTSLEDLKFGILNALSVI